MNRWDAEVAWMRKGLNRQDAEVASMRKGLNRQDAEVASMRKGLNRQDAEVAERVRIEPGAELDGLAHRVIGAAIEVHRLLGPGFLESVYEEALCLEFTLRGIRFARQVPIGVEYKGQEVGKARLDLVVGESLAVEIKALEGIAPIHVAQLLSYLKATRLRLGLLITFNTTMLRHGIKRVIHNS